MLLIAVKNCPKIIRTMPRSTTIPSNNTFSQNYVALCQVHSLHISSEVVTPQLDSDSLLHIDLTRIKRFDFSDTEF